MALFYILLKKKQPPKFKFGGLLKCRDKSRFIYVSECNTQLRGDEEFAISA